MSHVDIPIMQQGPAASPTPTSTSANQHNQHYPTHHPSRDVAMTRDQSQNNRDGSGDRGASDRDRRVSPTGSHPIRPSPPLGPRHLQDYRDRPRRTRDDEFHERNDEQNLDAGRRGRSRDRNRDYQEGIRRVKDRPSREEYLDYDDRHDVPTSPRPGHRPNDHTIQSAGDRSFSPSSRKRRRSPSPLLRPPSRPKKSRRDRERDRRRKAERLERFERAERGHPQNSVGPRLDRRASPSRRRSHSPGYDDPRSRYSDRAEPLEPPRQRRRSRSPAREETFGYGPPPPTRLHLDTQFRDRSRSPQPTSRRSSFSRTHSPPRSLARPPPGSSEAGAHSRRSSPMFEPPRADFPPRSPRGSRRSRKKAKHRDDSRFGPRGPLASGANSIEVSMPRRGDARGNFGAQIPPTQPSKYNDPRYVQSPPHATSGSSFHGSPTSQSPHGSTRAGRDGPPQYSPPHRQHPPQHPQGNRPPPTGPSAHIASSQSPPHPPTGPRSQSDFHGRGFSRGGFRGGFDSPRGGHRGGAVSRAAWGSGGPAGPGRGHSSQSGENTPQNEASNPSNAVVGRENGGEDESELRPPYDTEVEDSTVIKDASEQMLPPGPPPSAPTGPANSKFSFAFKATSKAPVATPKPEISQKFSAASKKEPQPVDDRDRDLPRDTPREPASARARADYHHSRPPPAQQPRIRKVKKTERKLKPKPLIPADLAKSSSVYFRKPGNESVVGSGTYGKVFKGLHVYTKKLVALKKIRMEGERDGFPVTAIREIKLLQSLRHTNIVNLQEVMVEENNCYMVFEYLSHDLTGLLNHPSYTLDPAQKKHLAKQLFEGLDYLHKRGVLHRDIKAANILVSSDGILKIADFGLARFYAKHHQYDYTNRVITIWYRSPELLLGETQYGAAVDIWSAACVMVEIFTRHAIFPGDGGEISQLDKIYNVLGTPNKTEWPTVIDMPWFELLRPGYRKTSTFAEKYKERLPAAAFELLADMFQYDPDKRPSAADVLEHPYFTTEYPPPRQAVELQDIKGDWHEFESKALRREKEKQEKEARRAAAGKEGNQRDKERKRPPSSHEAQPEPKRPHVEGPPHNTSRDPSSTVLPAGEVVASGTAAE